MMAYRVNIFGNLLELHNSRVKSGYYEMDIGAKPDGPSEDRKREKTIRQIAEQVEGLANRASNYSRSSLQGKEKESSARIMDAHQAVASEIISKAATVQASKQKSSTVIDQEVQKLLQNESPQAN